MHHHAPGRPSSRYTELPPSLNMEDAELREKVTRLSSWLRSRAPTLPARDELHPSSTAAAHAWPSMEDAELRPTVYGGRAHEGHAWMPSMSQAQEGQAQARPDSSPAPESRLGLTLSLPRSSSCA
ncbi:hypothetical protein Dimus_005764 [Dionaea muscipula]